MVRGLPARSVLFLLALGFLLGSTVVFAQGGGEEYVMPEAEPESPSDSLAMAPNDSAQVAARIAGIIEEKESNFFYRLRHSGIGDLYVKGGLFMHFLLASSIIGLVFILERAWTLWRARTNIRKLMNRVIQSMRTEGVKSALEVCERTRGPIAAILHAGLMRADRGTEQVEKSIETAGTIEMSFLERGLNYIAMVSNIAPLLGFLGTVSGMISAFAAIAAAEQVSAKLVASGIQEALITTATGLAIAIPCTFFHGIFVSRIDRYIIEMEETSAELVNELIEMES
jgi:biopolymer transport protein ExbB